jgi:two-component system sensor histidine kinase AlgZ
MNSRTVPLGDRHFFVTGVVIAAWLLLALASTHALMAQRYAVAGAADVRFDWPLLTAELLRFAPWAAIAQPLFWLASRFPVDEDNVLRPIAVHALAAVLTVPLVNLAGIMLARSVDMPNGFSELSPERIPWAVVMMSLFSLPIYLAVAATGQALAYADRYRTRERLLAQAQLRALQAQINPHFLFNTLNAVAALGHRDPARAETALSHLSDLIRTALADRTQTVPLKDEVAFARAYVDLYEVLLPGKIQATFDADDKAWNAAVPTMLLQPLIENAIVHGIAKRAGGGRISLAAHERNGRLTVALTNEPAELPPAPGNALGLANTRERLRALYGETQSCELTASPDAVTVTVTLPFTSAKAPPE